MEIPHITDEISLKKNEEELDPGIFEDEIDVPVEALIETLLKPKQDGISSFICDNNGAICSATASLKAEPEEVLQMVGRGLRRKKISRRLGDYIENKEWWDQKD
ncbi:hypothetical protein M422DRAFT_245592 [Sphaerobolus stellatus SS14]|nr:hypothetical protein M422DRAFT_245592 [Sphaerobolus stellatus SS14]